MNIAKILMSVGACAAVCGAEVVNIVGTVTDKATGSPLKGAIVRLLKSGLADTTDDAGKFQLAGTTTSIGDRAAMGQIPSLDADGGIRFILSEDALVSIESYSPQGARIASSQDRLGAGSYRIGTPVEGQGTWFHRIRIGDQQTILKQSRYGGTSKANRNLNSSAMSARSLAAGFPDTLEATLTGYGSVRVEAASATQTNVSIQLTKNVPPPPGTLVKARVINTTDLGADPDDEESLVHMFVTANEVDIEGLIVVTSCWKKSQSSTAGLDKFLNAYGQVVSNLNVHASGFPTLAYMKSISVLGQKGYSMGDVGVGKDSQGSDLIIAAADKNDPRPVWVNLWGGANTLAQAITKVKNTRTQSQLDQFLSKLRVYDVLGQDEAGAWIAKNFPNLLYIRATAVYGWQYSKDWTAANIQNKGPLGSVYPTAIYAIEGDSPAFMHQLATGLNDPNAIDQGGWGARFDLNKKQDIASMSAVTGEGAYKPYFMYANTSEGSGATSKWSDGYTNDFAARMIWSTTSSYAAANHHPIAIVNGDKSRNVLYITAKAGSDVVLDGDGSSDPDKNSLNWNWSQYTQPSTGGTASISGSATSKATVKAPAAGKTLHIVLTLKDNGSPALTAYRRVVITGN